MNRILQTNYLYKSSEVINPTWKLCVLCNNLPNFDTNEDAVWERTRCVKFPTKFVDNPVKDNEKKKINGLEQQFTLWAPDFILLLIEKYKQYKNEGLKETKSILEFTQQHKESGDYILQFMKEHTQESKTKHTFTSVLFSLYASWMKRNHYPDEYVGNNRTFCTALGKIYPNNNICKIKVKGISGYGIKNIILNSVLDDINDDE